MAGRPVEGILTAIREQTVTDPGMNAAALVVASLADSLQAALGKRNILAARIEEPLEATLFPRS